MTDLEKWVLKEMIEHLKDMEGQRVYGSDLEFALFESENCTGSYTCSSYQATKWIMDYFDSLGVYVKAYTEAYGMSPACPFKESEVFQVQLIIFIARNLLELSSYVKEHWYVDEEIELTSTNISRIANEWSKYL